VDTLAAGTRFGPYEIVAPLGAGGMGAVYRARDTRLGREVAIKVLLRHLSENPEVRARFEREARTISSLNHPNICTLFDVGREGETDYLVMELVEGETLAARLRRGPLPTGEVLKVGAQIADALDRAHRAGVVHRDLKPGNIILTRSGAKLMDFGLARATGLAGDSGSALSQPMTQSPTMASPLTAEGTIVGTFQYMAPEQLEGKEADARSDLWAFGCVLYEMATGKRAFEGRSQASLIAAIMHTQPAPVSQLAPLSPPGLERLVNAMLAKDPQDRVQDAHDVRLQLQWAGEAAGISSSGTFAAPGASPTVAAAPAGKSRLPWILASITFFFLFVATVIALALSGRRGPAHPSRFEIPALSEAQALNWPRVSPDGRYILFQTRDSSGVSRAWIRAADELEPHQIAGTEGLRRAYWSPDSREIAFLLRGKIVRLPISGGTPSVVCETVGGADLSWGARGTLLMDGQFTDSLCSVPARGGALKPAARIDRKAGEIGTAWPCFLPDGEHFLFIGNTRVDASGGNIRLGRLGSLDSQLLGHSDGRTEYAAGWVAYLAGTTLLARKLDLGAGKLTGEPITLAENVMEGEAEGNFSLSPAGGLAFRHAAPNEGATVEVLDRAGRPVAPSFPSEGTTHLAVSPDGRWLLTLRNSRSRRDQADVWLRGLDTGFETQRTFGGHAGTPVWSPDSKRFAWTQKDAKGAEWVLIAPTEGGGVTDSIALRDSLTLTPWSWSPGNELFAWGPGYLGMYRLPVSGTNRVPVPFDDPNNHFAHPLISPDGKFLAYVTGSSPVNVHVFVRTMSEPPGRWQVTGNNTIDPAWTQGGKELVLEDDSARLFSVAVDTRTGFSAGAPRLLFRLPFRSELIEGRSWTVTADGQRFYVLNRPPARTSGIEYLSDVKPTLGGE
jgi:Tol biopolymer transport system component